MPKSKGFTLLEILVAVVLFATVGGLLLQTFHGGLRQVSKTQRYLHAALLAQGKLDEIRSRSELKPGISEGSFPDGYRWRLSLTPFAIQNGGDAKQRLALLKLSLQVFNEESTMALVESETLVRMPYRP